MVVYTILNKNLNNKHTDNWVKKRKVAGFWEWWPHTHTHICMYVCMYVCVCVCVEWDREQEKEYSETTFQRSETHTRLPETSFSNKNKDI